jgi:hypothetical protein
MEQSEEGRVVAKARPPRGLVIVLSVLLPLQVVVCTVGALRGDRFYAVLAVAFGVMTILALVLRLGGPNAELVLTPDRIVVRRRLGSFAIPRADVLGVRGNIEGRPEWSEQVVVETAAGPRPLPVFGERPAELIPVVQAWATTGGTAA